MAAERGKWTLWSKENGLDRPLTLSTYLRLLNHVAFVIQKWDAGDIDADQAMRHIQNGLTER